MCIRDRPSSSAFTSPVTLTYKKDENVKNRLCVDYRELNKIVVPQGQPFPLIEELILKTQNCSWFTSLYHFGPYSSAQKISYKAAFVTKQGQWQWINLPFGLHTASAIFQGAISSMIRKYNLSEFCVAYIDDILIFSKDYNSHIEHVNKVMEAVYREGWKLKFEKCTFVAN